MLPLFADLLKILLRLGGAEEAQAVARDATALLTACGLALRSFDN